ncbi:uncharacterized protein LOC62_05G007425 [Vanrija pseudolonga]|uniref:Uncharacterized protein n=1 Tax=Vanrija pseudolonga TaxID=143232 RepID=A0AAF1BJV4_9TREE|nr:hypothetical protein LOC62_05G007425 [Vanrija pseudolonga]
MRTTSLTPRQPRGQSPSPVAAKIQQQPPPTPGPSSHKPTAAVAPFAARSLVRAAPAITVSELDHESAWGDDEGSEFGDGASEASFYSLAHECGVNCACSDTDGDSVATVLDTPDLTIPSPTATITSLPEDDTPKKDEVSVGWSQKSWGTASCPPRNPTSTDQKSEYGLLSNHARKQLEDLGPDWKPDWAKVHQPVTPLDPTSPEFEDLLVRAWVAIHDRWKAKVAEATRSLSHYTPFMLSQSTEPQEITLRIIHMWIDVCDSVDNLAVIASYLWFDEAGKLPPSPPGHAEYDAAGEASATTPRYPKLQQAKRDYPVPHWAFEDGAEYIMKRQSPVYSITSSPRIPPRILRRLLDGDIPDARIYYPLWVPPQTKSSWLWWF